MATEWVSFLGQRSFFLTYSICTGLRPLDLGASQERAALILTSDGGTTCRSLIPGIFHESPHDSKSLHSSREPLTTSAEFPPRSMGKNSLLFQGELLVALVSALPHMTNFKGQVKIPSSWGEVPLRPFYGDLAPSYTCLLPFLGLFSFLFLPSPWLQGAPLSMSWKGEEHCAYLTYFSCIPERELQQECCRQGTSGPLLTTFHKFKSLILMDAKATAEKDVREERKKDIF